MSSKGTSPSPGRTAVYRLFDAQGQLLYVGISRNPSAQWQEHLRQRWWWGNVASKVLDWHPTRKLAHAAMKTAIAEEVPLYNIAHTPLHRQLSEWYRPNFLTDDEWSTWKLADTPRVRNARQPSVRQHHDR